MPRLNATIKDILDKKIIPTKIYKDKNNIEINHTSGFISIMYKDKDELDADFNRLEKEVFGKLTFNPYILTD